jgi:antitoxin component YwqK of YwqJK toxin-antitoxin module
MSKEVRYVHHDDGKIKSTTTYYGGVPYEEVRHEYYDDGKLKSKKTYVGGVLHGKTTLLHWRTGNIRYVRWYSNGRLHGKWKKYDSYSNGFVRVRRMYVRGERHGDSELLHGDGNIAHHGLYVRGKRHGTFVSYDGYGTCSDCYYGTTVETRGTPHDYVTRITEMRTFKSRLLSRRVAWRIAAKRLGVWEAPWNFR